MALQLHTKSTDTRLMQVLHALRADYIGWQAVWFHLDHLLEQYKSEYQSKIAINLIHDLLKTHDGDVILLPDHSIIVLCKALEPTLLNKLIFQLRYLYMDDPLAYADTGQENPAFSTVYTLKRDWKEFFDLCAARAASPPGRKPTLETPAPEKAKEKESEAKPPAKSQLSATALASIERELDRTDLQKAVRRQPVCAMTSAMAARRVFDELYIHIAYLRQMLRSEVDFLSDRWLFKYLTHTLDRRMLAMIRQNAGRYLGSPISLNLNVETLLSPEFQEFDAVVTPAAKVSIVFEIPIIDVFADMTAYMAARDEVQQMGYRICLDGLNSTSLSSISREKLGADLVKLQWNADRLGDMESKENLELRAAVETTGSNRVILCRCDNRDAVKYGQALGISLFQGRYLDGLLNPTTRTEN